MIATCDVIFQRQHITMPILLMTFCKKINQGYHFTILSTSNSIPTELNQISLINIIFKVECSIIEFEEYDKFCWE